MEELKLSIPLPNKLSELLQIALDDLIEVEKLPHTYINMGEWLLWEGETCNVCMAGSVMLKRTPEYVVKGEQELIPSDYSPDTQVKLTAINLVRTGRVSAALVELGISAAVDGYLNRDMPKYTDGKPAFKEAIRELIADLKAAGF